MESILLINSDDILHFTQISPNIDVFKINPHILNAQVLYLEPLIGSDLYEKLLSIIENDELNLVANANYKTLLIEYVTPSVVFHTMEIFIPLNSFMIGDGGTFQFAPNNANVNTQTEIDRISKKYQIIGAKYDEKMLKYLCANSTLFPEYTNNTGLVNKTNQTKRISGWNLNIL